ncbi:NUDIX domain-containing protein [Streptomyces sp. NPDC058464]|uniref:NUDIX domain-containing protein n=1 Tax=Streptomyces sp. NPDC058464 TaxID=3346511 RepID=UPI003649DA5A
MSHGQDVSDWFTDPPPRRVGVHALITRGPKLLGVTRPYRQSISQWGLPGGSVAANELRRAGLSRHLATRLGLQATAGRLLVIDDVPEKPGQHREGTNYVYQVEIPDDVEPTVTEVGGFGEAKWIDRDQLGHFAVAHSLRRIQQSLLAAKTELVAELFLGDPQYGSQAVSGPAA